jgi:hypothetical protein
LTELQGKVDFGIITIREDEFEAVLARFPSVGRVSGRGNYEPSAEYYGWRPCRED